MADSLFSQNVALAPAGIHKQPQNQRQIRIARKVFDDLWPVVFRKQKVVAGEVTDDFAVSGANRGKDIHDLDVAGEYSGGPVLRPERPRGES